MAGVPPCISYFFVALFCEPALATRATQREYSGELGAQNDSKMEPKMDQTVIQKAITPNNMKHTLFAAIYYTLAMSATSQYFVLFFMFY